MPAAQPISANTNTSFLIFVALRSPARLVVMAEKLKAQYFMSIFF